MTVPAGSYPEQPPIPSPGPSRPYSLRLQEQTFANFQRAVLRLAADLGRPVPNSEAMAALCEMVSIDRPFQAMVKQHLTQARSLKRGNVGYKATVRLSGAAGDALDITVRKLGAAVGKTISINDTMEALAFVLPHEPAAAGRLLSHLRAKDRDAGRVAAALDLVVAGVDSGRIAGE